MVKAKNRIFFNQELCKGCALCTKFCPVEIIRIESGKINQNGYHPAGVKETERCLGCGNCVTICPDAVITIEREEAEGGGVVNGQMPDEGK